MRPLLRWVAVVGWTLFVGGAQLFKGGNVGSFTRCANEPTCGDVWWHPWAAWLIGLAIIWIVARLTRDRPSSRRRDR